MESSDVTIEILKSIRDEVRGVSVRLDQTRAELTGRIDRMSDHLEHLDGRMERVERRLVETEVRLATELVAVVTAIGDLKEAILEDRQLRRTVEDHEGRIQAIERRLPT